MGTIDKTLKRKVHAQCLESLEKRVESLRIALQAMQDSANLETKSSAGDKYETGRAMAQLEIEKLHEQLAGAREQLYRLQRIQPENRLQVVKEGALVRTDKMHLYFSVSAGTFKVGENSVITLSMASGLGMAARGFKAGESFSFRNQTHQILEVC